MKKLLFILLNLTAAIAVFGQTHFSTQPHQAAITNIQSVPGKTGWETAFFTSGEDGFLIRWGEDNTGEHYQISDVAIKMIAVSPNGNDVAVYESDGGSVNKISVWDWKNLVRKYQKNFTDSITSLAFSAKGNYLIIGTATVDGAIFVRTANWTVIDKIKANTSIVNYIHTSDTEKTVAFYSPSGSLSYYNLATGALKQKISVVQGLSNPVMFNSNIFLAGIKDSNIYVINAFKGNPVTSIPAVNPIILSTSDDKNLYYLEYDGKYNYELKMLEVIEDSTDGSAKEFKISNPRIVKTFKGPRGEGSICQGTKNLNDIYLGSRNGTVYKTDIEPYTSTVSFTQITENTWAKLLDIAAEKASSFYFLTSDSLYKSNYDSGVPELVCSNDGHTHVTSFNDKVILWTKGTRQNVVLKNFNGEEDKLLFTPNSSLQSVRYFNVNSKDYLVEIESNSSINIYDFESSSLKNIYSGAGIQDAVFADNGIVYIAKTTATNPQVPLICVNPETLETVPLGLKGNVAYALNTDGKTIYGINLMSDDSIKNTYVFSYNTSSKLITNILKFSDEDSEAFTYLKGQNLFTNIGKNKVYCYNLQTKSRFAYNRSASIPVKIVQNDNSVVILNSNGSISWCTSKNQTLLADWYLKTDRQWYEVSGN